MEIFNDGKEIVQQLEQYGLKLNVDFHLDPVYKTVENQNTTMKKEKVGYHLLDSKYYPVKLEKIIEIVEKLPTPKYGFNQCGICGKRVVVSKLGIEMDSRSINSQLRCFDHIGIEKGDF